MQYAKCFHVGSNKQRRPTYWAALRDKYRSIHIARRAQLHDLGLLSASHGCDDDSGDERASKGSSAMILACPRRCIFTWCARSI